MNGKLQGIIICGVTAACLVGVMAFLNSTSGKSDADSSSSSTAAVSSQDESVVILTKSSDDITSVKVSNEHGEYSVNKSESGKSTWSIPELGTLNANATAEASMISNLDGFKAKKLVEENVEDMSKYGLDKPTADLTVEYSDGTATTLHVGSVSPSNERYSYVSLDDEKDRLYGNGNKAFILYRSGDRICEPHFVSQSRLTTIYLTMARKQLQEKIWTMKWRLKITRTR